MKIIKSLKYVLPLSMALLSSEVYAPISSDSIKKRVSQSKQVMKEKEITLENSKSISYIEKKVIVFDPGHGLGNRDYNRYDPGATNKKIYEEVICWDQAKNLDSLSNKDKYKILISREQDKNSHVHSRKKVADNSSADAFISLHVNDSPNSRYRGFEIIYGRHKDSRRLAESISHEMQKIPGIKARRVKKRTIETVLSSWNYPSVMVESGFIDNKEDLKYLTDLNPDVELAIKRGYERFFEKGHVEKINPHKVGVAKLSDKINK